MPSRLKSINSSFAIDFDTFLNIKREAQIDVEAVVADIVADIRTRGDAALLEYTTKFDRFELTAATIRVTPEEIAGAIKECSAQQLDALSLAAGRIKAFHEKQLPEDLSY